ncbi:MAG: sugar phosphate isomerase/epimerase, partial [uncultured Frankineae bacterium]
EARRLHRLPARQAAPRGAGRPARSRARQRGGELRGLPARTPPARGAAAHKRRSTRRLPRPVRRRRDHPDRAELQRQPPAPGRAGSGQARPGRPRRHRARGAARGTPSRHHVGTAGCRGGGHPARVVRAAVGQRLPRRPGLPVGRGGAAVLARRAGPRRGRRRQGVHRDAPAQRRLQPSDDAAAGDGDRRHPRRSGDGPESPDVAADRPGRGGGAPRGARVQRCGEGHPDERRRQDQRCAGRPLRPCRSGRPGGRLARRPLHVEPLADAVVLGLRRRGARPRHRVVGALPGGAGGRRPGDGGQHRARGPGARPARGAPLGRRDAAGRGWAL